MKHPNDYTPDQIDIAFTAVALVCGQAPKLDSQDHHQWMRDKFKPTLAKFVDVVNQTDQPYYWPSLRRWSKRYEQWCDGSRAEREPYLDTIAMHESLSFSLRREQYQTLTRLLLDTKREYAMEFEFYAKYDVEMLDCWQQQHPTVPNLRVRFTQLCDLIAAFELARGHHDGNH